MKRVFGLFEAAFDVCYLAAALIIGIALLVTPGSHARFLAGVMALVLAGGDAFHLLPRIALIVTHKEEQFRAALGTGKLITSITMTLYYLLLWQIGLSVFPLPGLNPWTYFVYLLAAVRILICLLPQNRWQDRFPPVSWGIWRNLPFFLLGAVVAGLFFSQAGVAPGIGHMGTAILLSFACYLPVVVWSNRKPQVGMLMLPKTCAYLWMLAMCLSL